MKFKQIIYLISATVVITVAVQVYNNVQNYKVNKQRFQLDIQQALDQAIETYYADRARNEVIIFSGKSSFSDSLSLPQGLTIKSDVSLDSGGLMSTNIRGGVGWNTYFEKRDSIRATFSTINIDGDSTRIFRVSPDSIDRIEVMNHYEMGDSVELQLMAKKILFSLSNREIQLQEVSAYMNDELDRRGINVEYDLSHKKPHQIEGFEEKELHFDLVSSSKSTYLPGGEGLEIRYENASLAILKRGAFDLLISLLIIMAVVGSLLYLYKVINEQKQLAEIKNDLISNITHEFKTPIATISTAIEGISMFNQANDPEKTKKYLGISSDQLKKLNNMVEKLLETATLDSNEIELSIEPTDTVQITKKLIEKFDMVKGDKQLDFACSLKERVIDIDAFHMENAMSNLIDNALKYGGQTVSVSLSSAGEKTIWEVTDNGGKIDKLQQSRIFEKFYRIPTGNVHNVKGFGIGLYYTKAMVEKHGGTIALDVKKGETKFSISI